MDDNLVTSKTHQLVPMNYFDLNELPQEGTIIFILYVVHISFNV